jgi:protein O-mannosyl-transferase
MEHLPTTGSESGTIGPPPANNGDDGRKRLALCVLLFLLVGMTFSGALKNDFISFDDPLYVTANTRVQQGLTWETVKWAFGSTTAGLWHPLAVLSHGLDFQCYGLKPWGHHLTSVLLHAANTILVFLVWVRMTRATGRSFLVAALFGVHPLHVESVAWVAERKDVLSAFFWLLTILAYASYVEKSRRMDRRALFPYVLALGWFGLGLMAKPMLVTLPGVLLLLDYWPLQRWEAGRIGRLVIEKIPFLLLSVVASAITLAAQQRANTVVPLTILPLSARMENVFVSYARYLGKILYPIHLAAYYPHPGTWPTISVIAAIGLCLALTVAVILLRREQPGLLTGWLWFVGTLVPVIGLVQVGEQAMADRYAYVPLIGILLFLVWGMEALARRRQWPAFLRPALAGLAIGSAVILARQQVGWWKNDETLFRHAVAVTPNNYVAEDLLAEALILENRFDDAIEQLRRALHLKPGIAKLHCHLGIALEGKGQIIPACGEYREAVKLNPYYLEAHNHLGLALERQGLTNEAIRQFQLALQLVSDSNELHYNLGNALARARRWPEAAEQFQAALKLKPNDAGARNNLGVVLFQERRVAEAIEQFQQALQLLPDDAEARKNLEAALKWKAAAPSSAGTPVKP